MKNPDHVEPADYEDKSCRMFVCDMLAAGREPYHYNGRFSWEGPAVDADDYQDVIRETSVRLQRDGMGRGYVVYPVASCAMKEVIWRDEEQP